MSVSLQPGGRAAKHSLGIEQNNRNEAKNCRELSAAVKKLTGGHGIRLSVCSGLFVPPKSTQNAQSGASMSRLMLLLCYIGHDFAINDFASFCAFFALL